MKSGKIFTVLVGVLFVAIALATALNFKLYKDCNDRIEFSNKQYKLLNDKLNEFEMNISSFKINLEEFKLDYEKYKNDLSGKLGNPEQIKADISEKFESLKKEMQGMQDNYKAMQNDIKEKLNSIKKEFESSLGGAKKVDLGEISVKSEAPVKQ
jgi:chromosome segregation ATPase